MRWGLHRHLVQMEPKLLWKLLMPGILTRSPSAISVYTMNVSGRPSKGVNGGIAIHGAEWWAAISFRVSHLLWAYGHDEDWLCMMIGDCLSEEVDRVLDFGGPFNTHSG